MKTLILSKAKEQNYIKDGEEKSKDIFKNILEKSDKAFSELDKHKNELWGKTKTDIGAIFHYDENFKKLAFLEKLGSNSYESDGYLENVDFIEEEREFNRILKNLRKLKRNKFYFSGNLNIFNE